MINRVIVGVDKVNLSEGKTWPKEIEEKCDEWLENAPGEEISMTELIQEDSDMSKPDHETILAADRFGLTFSSSVIDYLQSNWDEVMEEMRKVTDVSDSQSRELRREVNKIGDSLRSKGELTYYHYD